MKSTIKNGFFKVNILSILAVSFLLGGCSNTLLETGDSEPLALLPADDIKQGPGIFSGEKGGFFLVKDLNKKPTEAEETTPNTVSKMNLDETSKVLEDKIKQLEKDKLELELLKQQVDKKIQTQ